MGLTVKQGVEAGKLAAKIERLSAEIASIDAAIEGKATLLQIVASTSAGVFQSDYELDAADTKAALTVMRGIVEANVEQLSGQLSALGK